ncbi:flagellar hook-length control protein FliK [Bradyrhizobium canariense]|uniref:Hook-length control protein FliK n=1 Tax=Bradyrhizobium canariense TaxID=255045 RepID=A0A1H1NQP7_9BRAD|nr:flagellar hook-length control protein FliK [Bradyrhizobium canariense]SDS01336.1 hook-length control protein FliK [Bradyrhizobium canariense]
MSIVINQSVPLVAVQGATADVVLQPGTVVKAQVLQILGNDQAQISIGGQSIDVVTQVPLQAGQTLQLSVSQASDGSIQLAVVNQQGGAAANQGAANPAAANFAADTVTLAPSAVANIAAQITSAIVLSQNQLAPLETLAVSAAAQTAATQQTSLAPLFSNLGVAAGISGLSPQLQQAVAQVLAQQTSLDPNLTGEDIKQAFQSSGLFLEASLAAGSVSSSGTPDLKAALIVLRQVLTTSLNAAAPTAPTPSVPTATATTVPQGTTTVTVVQPQGTSPTVQVSSLPVTMTAEPDMVATASPALAPLLTAEALVLNASEGDTPQLSQAVFEFSAASAVISSATTSADAAARTAASSAALNLLQEAVQAAPLGAANLAGLASDNGAMLSLLPVVAGARIAGIDEAEFARTNVPPPPLSGALPAAQPVMPATLVTNSSPDAAMRHLLTDTDGAIARQTLLQVASLPDQAGSMVGRIDPAAPRWNFEIPFATPQGTAMAQFEISRDGGGTETEAAKRVWRARFSLDVEPTGPVHALVSLNGDRTSVRMWAERPATADQLRAGVSQLSQALSRADLRPGDIVIRDGAPMQSTAARAGHFLDRAL